MMETVRRTSRNVKHWQSGEMCPRRTAAGRLEAERQFRRIMGHTDLAKLAVGVERDVPAPAPRPGAHTASIPAEEPATIAAMSYHPGPPPPKFHGRRDILPGHDEGPGAFLRPGPCVPSCV
jgi:hypothetical protein